MTAFKHSGFLAFNDETERGFNLTKAETTFGFGVKAAEAMLNKCSASQ